MPPAAIPETLKARVVSWDVGFKTRTKEDWIERMVKEVRDAGAAKVDVLVFPELFTAGLGQFAKNNSQAEFITREMHKTVLPAVKDAAEPGMLVVLGSYWHRDLDRKYAFNRAPVLIDGAWHFADKLHPTQGELIEDPPIKRGEVLPIFRFRGGTAAVVICFSLEMPEVSVALKKEGVQLVLGPSATEDEEGVARIQRASSARAVELGAAVLVAPLVGELDGWKNRGSAALYLPAQKRIDLRPQQRPLRVEGVAHDDFEIPWKALIDLRSQREEKPETRPFLAPVQSVPTKRIG
jgi:predicted amidohydrolase